MHRIGYSGGFQLLVTSNPHFSVDINSIIDGKRNDDDDDDRASLTPSISNIFATKTCVERLLINGHYFVKQSPCKNIPICL